MAKYTQEQISAIDPKRIYKMRIYDPSKPIRKFKTSSEYIQYIFSDEYASFTQGKEIEMLGSEIIKDMKGWNKGYK